MKKLLFAVIVGFFLNVPTAKAEYIGVNNE